MRNYNEALSVLNGRESKKLANNTYLKKRDNAIAVMLHQTYVVTYQQDGKIVLNSGGWKTHTTKDRINTYSPLRINQKKGIWYLSDGKLYHDGIIINPDLSHDGKIETKTDVKKINKLKKEFRQYAHDFVDALVTFKVPEPSNGDCWECLIKDDKGNTPFGIGHYHQHVKEKYFVPSLLCDAVKRYANSIACEQTIHAYMQNKIEYVFAKDRNSFIFQQVENAIYKFLKVKLGMAN